MKRPGWPRLIRASTRAFLQEARRTPNYSWLDWLHGYIYGRWTYLYLAIGLGEHPLARFLAPLAQHLLPHRLRNRSSAEPVTGASLADTYHAKVVPLPAARQLVTVSQEISLTNLEQVIPYNQARDIILKNPDHIVVLDCPCRAARPDPCLPLDVCLIIGEPFASFVAEHHPARSRWLSQAEAVEILEAEHGRGHVHHAFFKDAMLNRFYAICNCCGCCCGAMQAWRHGVPMLAGSGYISQIDPDHCIGCEACVDHCAFEALSVQDGLAMVDPAGCMGCGLCAVHCPQEAIALVREPSRGEPLEIQQL